MINSKCETLSFSREEFYEHLWTAPAKQVAEELGCSSTLIGKVCKSYDVPKPYSSYWALLARGKAPKKTPLPANTVEELQQLTFYKYPFCKTTVDRPPREAEFDEDIQDILIKHRSMKPVKVGDSLRSPHPLIRDVKDQWKQLDAVKRMSMEQRLQWMDRGRKRTIAIAVSKDLRSRALRIMDAFIKRIEKLGGSIEMRTHRHQSHRLNTALIIAEEHVSDIRLREKNNQVKTVNEEAKYSWDRNRTEMIPSGVLLIDRGPTFYGNSILAKDKKSQNIEEQLTSLVDRFIFEAGEMRIRTRIREEQEHQRKMEEIQRKEREQLILKAKENLQAKQEEEQRNVEDLFQKATCWKQSQILREYIAAFKDAPHDHGEHNEGYLAWAMQQADRLDPFCESPYSILDESIDEIDEQFQIRKPR